MQLRHRLRCTRVFSSISSRGNGNGGAGCKAGERLGRQTEEESQEGDGDLLKELCALVSSSASAVDVVASASSRSKSAREEMTRLGLRNRNREVCCSSSSHLSANRVLEVLESLKPGETIDEALPQLPSSELSDDLVAQVVLGARSLETACSFFRWASSRQHYRPGVLARECFVRVLIKSAEVESAYNKFREFFITEVSSSFTYCVLVEALGAAGDAERALVLFEEMKKHHSEHEIGNCSTFLINGLCKGWKFTEAIEQYEMLKGTLRLDIVVYNTLIEGLAKGKLVDKALAVLKDMDHASCQPDEDTFGALVTGLCKTGRTEEACEVFERMLGDGFTPHSVIYTTLIDGLCKTRQFEKAQFYFEQMKTPDIVTYGALIDGLCSTGKMDSAYKLLEQITERGNRPDVVVYTTLIKGLCKTGLLNDALQLFSKMKENGCPPNTVTYNALMRGLTRRGRADAARKLFTKMIKDGCQPDSTTYTIISEYLLKRVLLNGECEEPKDLAPYIAEVSKLCSAGKVEDAYRVFESLDESVQPTTKIYALLVGGFLQKGKFLKAEELVKDMLRRGCSPGPQLYDAVLAALLRLRKRNKLAALVDDILSEMAEKKWIPDALLCNNIIEGLCNFWHADYAYRLVTEVSKKGGTIEQHMWETLIRKLSRYGNNQLSLEAIRQAREVGCEIHAWTYDVVIFGLLKARLLDEAVDQFRNMLANGRPCSRLKVRTHGALVIRLCRRKRWDEAFELHQQLAKRGVAPSTVSYCYLIEHFIELRDFETVELLWQQTLQYDTINTFICDTVLGGYCNARMLDQALELFQRMMPRKIWPSIAGYLDLVRKLCEEDRVEEAHHITDMMLKHRRLIQTVAPFTLLFQGYYATGRFDKARQVFEEMTKRFNIETRRDDFPISQEQLRQVYSYQPKAY